jgi:ABC-type transporter Mla subunit MlaD
MKIGLFVVLSFVAAAALAIVLLVTRAHKKTTHYYTYFNESVTGLDVGAPVKARGVNVGQVGNIAFAPDRKMVQVRMDLEAGVLEYFGGTQPQGAVHPELRTHLATQGVNGTRFVAIDFSDPRTNPPPELSFATPPHYIPAAMGQTKGVDDSVSKAADRVANMVDTASREGLPEKTVQAVTGLNGALDSLKHFLNGLDRQEIPTRTATAIDRVRSAVDKIHSVLDRVDGDTGLIATVQHSATSIGEMGRSATGPVRDLDETLAEIREAAAAIRLLADEIEREPDILLKGRPAPRESSP